MSSGWRGPRGWATAVLIGWALAAAGQQKTVSLDVQNVPVKVVLQQVATQAGLQLVLDGAAPTGTAITLQVRRVSVKVAMARLCEGRGWTWQVADGRLTVRFSPATAKQAARKPRVEGLPETVLQAGREQLKQLGERPGDAAAVTAFGRWLAEQRPDWQTRLRQALPEIWVAEDATPARALLGARVLGQAGLPDAALRLLPVARREPRLEFDVHCLGAALELQRGGIARATVEARMAAKLAPERPEPAAYLATAMLYLGGDREALAEAVAAHARWPREPEVLAALGNILRRDPDAAADADRCLAQALELAPGSAEARYGQAVLAGRDAASERAPWLDFLRAEPLGVRADRVRLALAATDTIRLTALGGPAWDLTADGERALYYLRSRKQLEITDTRGTGLANQLTDQDTDKLYASISPDEEHLAWIVPDAAGDRLCLQATNASGKHVELLTGPRGGRLRRTAWSPDNALLVFGEEADAPSGAAANKLLIAGEEAHSGGRVFRTRCWDVKLGKEVPAPAPLDTPGLTDVRWLADGTALGQLVLDGRRALVAFGTHGERWLLRPLARGRYDLPSADGALTRVVFQGNELLAAAADGSEDGEVPIMTGVSSTVGALWTPDGGRLLVTVSDAYPTVLHLGGLRPEVRVLCSPQPLWQRGPRPPRYELSIQSLTGRGLRGTARATLVNDDGTTGWTQGYPLQAAAGQAAKLVLEPTADQPGVHWLRVDLTRDDVADPPRWYRYEIGT